MKLKNTLLLLAAFGLASMGTAQAGFINGGFETGDFTGWTLEHGTNNGGVVTYTVGPTSHAYNIGVVADPYSPFDSPINGTRMARLNEWTDPNADATRISQTATMLVGETDVFINWAAVLENPTDHSSTEQPYFDIDIFKNNVLVATESHNASQAGWTTGTPNGPNFAQIYYNSGQFHLAGLVAGDIVKVQMTVVDCSLTGHAGWAYLDGIGTVAQPPAGVPDGGSTAILLGLSLFGLAALRGKKK